MMHSRIIKTLFLCITLSLVSGCDCSNSSGSHHNYSSPYNNYKRPSYPKNDILSNEEIEAILRQIQSVPQPIQRQRVQNSEVWERGYSYGWDEGYEDAINGNGAWASYDDSGKGGDFLDGYESGYIDGYENGKNDRDEDDEEIEDL